MHQNMLIAVLFIFCCIFFKQIIINKILFDCSKLFLGAFYIDS